MRHLVLMPLLCLREDNRRRRPQQQIRHTRIDLFFGSDFSMLTCVFFSFLLVNLSIGWL